MALFAMQGEGIEEEQRKKEQMKKTGKELQAQREDNERRNMREKHRGGEKKTGTYTKLILMSGAVHLMQPPSLSLPAHSFAYNHSHSQPCTAGGLDGWTFIPDGCNDACAACVTEEH